MSVFNRITELLSGHVTDQVIVRRKCDFIWEWKTETSEGTFVQKQMWFFPVFLRFLNTAADWETEFGRSIQLKVSTLGPLSHDCSFGGIVWNQSTRFVFSSLPKIHKTAPKFESPSSTAGWYNPQASSTHNSSIQPVLKLLTICSLEKHEGERYFYTATTTFPNNWFHTALAPESSGPANVLKVVWWNDEQKHST